MNSNYKNNNNNIPNEIPHMGFEEFKMYVDLTTNL